MSCQKKGTPFHIIEDKRATPRLIPRMSACCTNMSLGSVGVEELIFVLLMNYGIRGENSVELWDKLFEVKMVIFLVLVTH